MHRRIAIPVHRLDVRPRSSSRWPAARMINFFGMKGNRVGLTGLIIGVGFAQTRAAGQAPKVSLIPSDSAIRQILVDRIDKYRQSVGIVAGVIEPKGRRIVSYGKASVTTGNRNVAVRRNCRRFPYDFDLQLSPPEAELLLSSGAA